MEKADGLSFYRQYAVQLIKSDPGWTPQAVADHLVKEVGIQPDKALICANEALALVEHEKG